MKCSISNIANVISESIPNPAESGFDIFVGLEHYDSGEVKVTRYGSTQNLVTAVKVFRKGDILLARRNVYLKRAGLVDFDGVTSGDSIVLRVKDDLSSLSLQSEDIQMYLPFVLNTEEFWNYAEKYSDGTMSKRLSPKTLLQYEFDIPDDVTEKNRLLWQAYKTKESYKAMITATDEMVKSQFIEMFGAPDFMKRLGDYVSVRTGKLDANASVEGGQYPFFTCAEKTLLIDTYAFDCNAVLLAGNGEFCVKHYNGKFNAYQRTYIIESKDESVLSAKYLYAWLKEYANILKANAIGGVIKYIKLGDITNAQINLPHQDKQLEYVKIYEQADKSKFELKQAIERIDKVMRALMQ